MLHYKIIENNSSTEWVTFLHGAGGSSAIWFKQIKAFSEKYNLLLLDLRGHGKSQNLEVPKENYTFPLLCNDVFQVLDFLKIKTSHFVGISLGTLIIRHLEEIQPNRVKKMVLGGAITALSNPSKLLLFSAHILKPILPSTLLYKVFANIILPLRNHKESRTIFIQESKRLTKQEFSRWFMLTKNLQSRLDYFFKTQAVSPSFYIMGDQDFFFLETVKKMVVNNPANNQLAVIKNCGHVTNIEHAEEFNKLVLNYFRA